MAKKKNTNDTSEAKYDELYRCPALKYNENFIHMFNALGETHTLGEWIALAFPSRTKEELYYYFADDTQKDIVEYFRSAMRMKLVKDGEPWQPDDKDMGEFDLWQG